MEQVIGKLRATLDEILKIKGIVVVEREKVADLSRKQDEVAQFQAEQVVAIEKREDAVKPIEDVVKFKVAAEEMAKRVDDSRISLENAKNAFEAYKKSERATLATKRAEVDKLEAMYKREIEALNKAKEEYETKKADVKGEVLDGLKKNL